MRGENMDGIYEWVRSLLFYLILMTMILNLLPDKKYEKYLRLFTGMVFILLVFRPFTDLSGMEARMAGIFEAITFQNDVKLLKRELKDMEGERMERLISGYREAVELDLKTMAEGFSLECESVSAVFDISEESETFGSLKEVAMVLKIPKDRAVAGMDERLLGTGREMERLKSKIGEYYGLEEGKISINLEN